MPVATPAKRARARRDPAVLLPPAPPTTERDLRGLHLRIAGVPYLIGPSLVDDGDQAIELTMDGASTLTLTAHDPEGSLLRALPSEDGLLQDGVRVVIDGITYVLTAVDPDTDRVLTLTFIDEVAWRLEQFSSFRSANRNRGTDGEFVLRMVDEASRAPLAPMRAFIPELGEKLRIARPETTDVTGGRGQPSTEGGLGDEPIKVKGERANATQRRTANGILRRAAERRASRRVMTAAIMASTQESELGRKPRNGIHLGAYHQNPAYGPAEKRMDPGDATDGFLDEWKRIHGSVKTAPGDLAAAIEQVQRSGLSPSATYGKWKDEATDTVDTFLGGSSDDSGVSERSYPKTFYYTRGDRNGERETSWAAIGRMATDEGRGKRRWAALNTLFYVSDRELRAAASSVVINGDEGFIVERPDWEWGAVDRPAAEVSLSVLSERWSIMPGAVATIAEHGPAVDGRYLVAQLRDDLRSPVTTVTLRRPARIGVEPAHEIATSSSDDEASSDSGSDDDLKAAAKHISDQGRPYRWGGGHDKPLSKITPSEGLDCSGSVALALKRAGMFDGANAIVSGEFASSWGRAGKGRTFTVWANGTHVWIEFSNGDRFDTSPYGDGPSGPRYRTKQRNDQSRFTARHWPGK